MTIRAQRSQHANCTGCILQKERGRSTAPTTHDARLGCQLDALCTQPKPVALSGLGTLARSPAVAKTLPFTLVPVSVQPCHPVRPWQLGDILCLLAFCACWPRFYALPMFCSLK
eukprot:366520-Chlamydomonas_euryale.AAC.13